MRVNEMLFRVTRSLTVFYNSMFFFRCRAELTAVLHPVAGVLPARRDNPDRAKRRAGREQQKTGVDEHADHDLTDKDGGYVHGHEALKWRQSYVAANFLETAENLDVNGDVKTDPHHACHCHDTEPLVVRGAGALSLVVRDTHERNEVVALYRLKRASTHAYTQDRMIQKDQNTGCIK